MTFQEVDFEHWIEKPQKSLSPKQYRKVILERDNYQCQCKCGCCESRYDLDIHHIIPQRNGGSSDFDNLITLCHSCHMRIEFKLQRDHWNSLH